MILALLAAAPAHAAGSATVTSVDVRIGDHVYRRYTIAWTSTAGGAVSGNAFAVAAGPLMSIRFTPGGTTPTDLYDVTLAETAGATDLTGGQGANQSATVSGVYTFDPPLLLDGSRTLDVVIANAGASKTGTVVILVQVR